MAKDNVNQIPNFTHILTKLLAVTYSRGGPSSVYWLVMVTNLDCTVWSQTGMTSVPNLKGMICDTNKCVFVILFKG